MNRNKIGKCNQTKKITVEEKLKTKGYPKRENIHNRLGQESKSFYVKSSLKGITTKKTIRFTTDRPWFSIGISS